MERWRIQPGGPELEIEERADGDDDEKTTTRLRGYATVYGAKTVWFWDEWRELVAPGAYDESVRRDDVCTLWQHDDSQPLGRVSSGTMRVWSDDVGVGYAVEPPGWAAGYVETVRRKDVTQSSIGFDVLEDEWGKDPDEDDKYLRTIHKARMWEASPVTWPAVLETSVGVAQRSRYSVHSMISMIGGLPALPADLSWKEEAGRMRIARRTQAQGVDVAATELSLKAAAAMADLGLALRA